MLYSRRVVILCRGTINHDMSFLGVPIIEDGSIGSFEWKRCLFKRRDATLYGLTSGRTSLEFLVALPTGVSKSMGGVLLDFVNALERFPVSDEGIGEDKVLSSCLFLLDGRL